MTEDELRDVLRQLEEQGWQPKLCDTPVGVSLSTVQCGLPTELGDDMIDDYLMLPKALVGQTPEIFVPAVGESMRDAGYEPGDRLRVRLGVKVQDGDNVLVLVDGAATVKTLFTDEECQQWLVPRNEQFDAILLREDMDVRILGRVVGVEKTSPRASSREVLQSIRRTKQKMQQASRLTPDQVDEIIKKMGCEVQHARQWYAVMRALADSDIVPSADFDDFSARVRRLLPEHEHLPDAKELSRVAVLSFARPVALWSEENAPVSGKRFRDYLSIAQKTARELHSDQSAAKTA